jgi:integrase
VLAEEAIVRKIADRAWHKDRRRDVEAAVTIFIAANGYVAINRITQAHLIAMKDSFPRLPREYGRKRVGPDGKKVRETIAEAVARGHGLLEQWEQDPVKAEKDGLAYVGLSLTTQKKHLTWISALITHIEGHYPQWVPSGIIVKAVRKVLVQPKLQGERHAVKSGQKKNEGRLPWKPKELAMLFNAPVWQGCAGLWSRLASGPEVCHDDNYWALLLIATTVARADEICGLAINDAVTDCDVPHLKIQETSPRRIENQASVRGVPIASRIIKLGFLDYVAAIKEAGHAALFPEYRHHSTGFDKVFYKDCFAPLRAHVFPSGNTSRRTTRNLTSSIASPWLVMSQAADRYAG